MFFIKQKNATFVGSYGSYGSMAMLADDIKTTLHSSSSYFGSGPAYPDFDARPTDVSDVLPPLTSQQSIDKNKNIIIILFLFLNHYFLFLNHFYSFSRFLLASNHPSPHHLTRTHQNSTTRFRHQRNQPLRCCVCRIVYWTQLNNEVFTGSSTHRLLCICTWIQLQWTKVSQTAGGVERAIMLLRSSTRKKRERICGVRSGRRRFFHA
jgi:hypothetical protein